MTARLKTVIALLAVLLAVVCFRASDTARGEARGRQQAKAEPQPLTEQERRGRQIYLRGKTVSGVEIKATLGEIEVPGSTMTCAGCHGMRGEGKTEGAVSAESLRWSSLIKPYGHTDPPARKHPTFTEASFARAVTDGVDPAGNALLAAMPRYKIRPEDMADLIAYLKRVEFDLDPGLTSDVIKVAVLLPASGSLVETGAAMREILAAYFSEVNGRGGVFNRKIVLSVTDLGSAAAREAVRREQIFAFVGGITAGADKELGLLAREEEVPFVGPATLLPLAESPPNRYVFYLLSGVGEQARALVNFAAAKPELKSARAVVINAEGALTTAAATAAEDQARNLGWGSVARQSYAPGSLDAAKLVQILKAQGTDAVFFFGPAGDEGLLIEQAHAAAWTPRIFLVGAMTGRQLVGTLPTAFGDKVFVSFPTVPQDVTGLAEFRALAQKYNVAPRHTASQISALAAAKIFVEGLNRAGKDLNRENLIVALEGLYDFDTGLTPHVTFGPNRRVGAAGAYVVTIDPAKKEFVPASGWVNAY